VGGDYGPYYQSQRLKIYQEAARRLVDGGYAYRCYCSPQRLEEMRAEQVRRHQPPGYDRRCRYLSDEERFDYEAQGIVPVVRFKVPLSGQTTFTDLIKGEVTVDNSHLDDFVLLKSDGYPTYHLANVCDDHLMEISHVIRADEWLSSTPRHKLLYDALGYSLPHFAHLPMILGPDRSKLGKRHGATSVVEFREQGYLPEAMVNFLALLGWSLDDRTEIIGREELIRNFSLERISKTGAIFSHQKLLWMNGVYIRQLPVEDLAQRMMPFLDRDLPASIERPVDKGYLLKIVPLIQERMKLLSESAELTDFFFVDDLAYEADLLLMEGLPPERSIEALEQSLPRLQALPNFDAESLEGLLRPLAGELGLKTGQFFGLLRVATTGRTAAPPLFQTMEVLGRDRCLKRLRAALGRLKD
jgi:glutamyl-tRNA synthetase